MNGPDWLEITILLQGNFTYVFSFRGTAPETPRQGGAPKSAATPPRLPRHHLITRGVSTPFSYTGPTLWYKINNIFRLHTQQSPTWRLIVTTPPLLHLLDIDSSLDLDISHIHHHPWRPIETEHNLSFSLVTTFVSISVGFWLVCIFPSFNCP